VEGFGTTTSGVASGTHGLLRQGSPDLHFHDLRKTAITMMVETGVDIKTAQARLGVTEAVILRVYAQATERADREAVKKLAARLSPPPSRGVPNLPPPFRPQVGSSEDQ
jgi:integrase